MLISTTQAHMKFQQLPSASIKSISDQQPLIKLKRKLSTENDVSSIFCKNIQHTSNDCKTLISENDTNVNCTNIKNIEDDSIPSNEKRPRFSINDLLSASSALSDNDINIASTSNGTLSSDDILHQKTATNDNKNFNKHSQTSTTVKSKDVQFRKITKYSKRSIRPESIVVPPNYVPNGNSPKLANLRCTLETENKQLWTQFDKIGTEMIITKPGRRMFPMIKVRLENCELDAHYYIYLDVVPVDADRYRYVYEKSAWCSSGKADRTPPNRLLAHPDSPFAGSAAAAHTISFEKAKLTNNESNSNGMLILNSMHRYQPRLHVLRRDRALPPLPNSGLGVDLNAKEFRAHYRTFIFGETQFMAVTAYQNQLVTEMKIGTNPFAKGFRDHGNRRDPASEFIDAAAMNFNGQPSQSQPCPVNGVDPAITVSPSSIEKRPPAVIGVQLAAAAAAYAAATNYFGGAERLAAMVAAAGFPPHFARQQLNNYFLQQQHLKELGLNSLAPHNNYGSQRESTERTTENTCKTEIESKAATVDEIEVEDEFFVEVNGTVDEDDAVEVNGKINSEDTVIELKKATVVMQQNEIVFPERKIADEQQNFLK